MSAEKALQIAVTAALKAADVAGGRVYDVVPPGAPLPYVAIRQMQVVDDGADCVDGFEVFADLDAWSIKNSKLEATEIAGAVREVLHEADLILASPFRCLEIMHRETVTAPAEPNLTRARMTFRALVERIPA